MRFVWEKPVITFYKERFGEPITEPFVAVKAQSLVVSKDEKDPKISCILKDFFPIMGTVDVILTTEGKSDSYVLCWFDDKIDDFGKAFRRLTGVTFPKRIKCETDEKNKITCNATFEAKHGKLQ